jgi:hypothetical protein
MSAVDFVKASAVEALIGGTKQRQQRDIETARTRWTDTKERWPQPRCVEV